MFDFEFKPVITEYQAEILTDKQGRQFTALFPEGITQPVQYSTGVKAHAIYLSQHQLSPYERIKEYFTDQLSLPISVVRFTILMLKLMIACKKREHLMPSNKN